MKRLKILALLLVLSLSIVFVGCDIVYDAIYDSIYDGTLGDIIGGDGDGEGEEPDEEPGGDSSGEPDDDPEHVCDFTDWYVEVEPTCTESGLRERECIHCDKVERETLAKLDHTPEAVEAIAPTCTEDGAEAGVICSVCDTTLSGCTPIAKLGHTEVTDPYVAPTDTTPGKTEGKHCLTCGTVIVRQEYIWGGFASADKYDSDYAYNSLASFANGEAMQEFYLEIEAALDAFHHSDSDALEKTVKEQTVYYVDELKYSDNGIDTDEAIAAWCAFKMDNPLYYWMSNEISYNPDTISVLVYGEYASSEVRQSYNERIYETVKSYVENVGGEGDSYRIALSVHDSIISGANYAYEDDGVTPESDPFAHNVIGVLLDGWGVCESYAKSFQLFMNYFGIPNVYVSGEAGEPHAWNMARMDDGEWYWFDLTWDDRPAYGNGIAYNYFCITDNTNVAYGDGFVNDTPVLMRDNHIPSEGGNVGTDFFYELPERSADEYDGDVILLRDELITLDGLSYVVVGFRSVALVEIDRDGEIIIPESISYRGIDFDVVMIGDFKNGYFGSGEGIIKVISDSPYKTRNVTKVSIPKTVTFIWGGALNKCTSIKEFTVDVDNPEFTSYDGALFTKSLYTLVAYPLGSQKESFEIPEATREIAYLSLGDGGFVLYASNLQRIIIGENVEHIGSYPTNKGYRDAAPEDPSDIVMIDTYKGNIELVYAFKISYK